jgi:hypothetical protein
VINNTPYLSLHTFCGGDESGCLRPSRHKMRTPLFPPGIIAFPKLSRKICPDSHTHSKDSPSRIHHSHLKDSRLRDACSSVPYFRLSCCINRIDRIPSAALFWHWRNNAKSQEIQYVVGELVKQRQLAESLGLFANNCNAHKIDSALPAPDIISTQSTNHHLSLLHLIH